jgi:hypothetical protein
MLQKTDFLWRFAAPLYIMAFTIRHEASRALVAMLEGARITAVVFWPTRQGGQLY